MYSHGSRGNKKERLNKGSDKERIVEEKEGSSGGVELREIIKGGP